MTDPANLAAALAKVQAELPKLERDRTVEVETKKGDTYTYSYVTLANLSDAILPLLAKHGLSFAAMPGAGADGKMCVRYHLMHESGEALTGEFPVSGEGGIQMIGGRITYARRYCLAAIVGVAADEDDESRLSEDGPRTAQRAAARPKQQRQAPVEQDGAATTQRAAQRPRPAAARPPLPSESDGTPEGVTPQQRGKLMATFGQLDIRDRDARLNLMSQLTGRRLNSGNDLTKREASALIDQLEKATQEPDPGAFLGELVAARQSGGEPS